MKSLLGRTGRLIAVLCLMAAALVSTSAVAEAAPYGTTTISVTISFGTNAAGQNTVTITIVDGDANITFTIILHSVAVTLGSITLDANGAGAGSFAIPAGFTGRHEVELVNNTTGASTMTALTLPDVNAALPAPIIGSNPSTGGLPNTGAAVIGIGVLALVLLAGGGGLLLAGRRRGRNQPLG